MQTCIHKTECVLHEMTVSGIVIFVCAECRDEIAKRTTTPPEILPETPIEHYARNGKMPPVGCSYRLKGRKLNREASAYNCNAVCDDGQTHCPRHQLVMKAEAIEQEKKERELREKKNAALRAGARR